jgi:hypothetical protein
MSNERLPSDFRLLLDQLPRKEHTTLEDAKVIREMIRHEDDVIDQRITWLCQIQGFLFAALALTWKEPTESRLVPVICLVGLLVAVSSGLALRSARLAISNLVKWWDNKIRQSGYLGPDVFARRVGKSFTHLLPWTSLPVLFFLAWISILVIKIMDP